MNHESAGRLGTGALHTNLQAWGNIMRPYAAGSGTREVPIDLDEDDDSVGVELVDLGEEDVIEIGSEDEELEEQIILSSDIDLGSLDSDNASNTDDAWYYWSTPVLRTFSEFLISVGDKHTDETNKTQLTKEGCAVVRRHIRIHHSSNVVPDSLEDEYIQMNLRRLHSYYIGYLSLMACGWVNYNRKLGSFELIEKKFKPDDLIEDLEVFLKESGVKTNIINVTFFFNENCQFLDELHYYFKKDDWADKAPVASEAHQRRYRIPETRS